MAITTRLRTLTFSDGTSLPVPARGVTVLVGPNNAGKSAALKEIQHHLTGLPRPIDQPARVVVGVELSKAGSAEDLREWLDQNTHAMTLRNNGQRMYTRPNLRLGWEQAWSDWNQYPNAFGQHLWQMFVLPAYTEQRLSLVQGGNHWNPMEESPSAPIQILFEREELEARLSEISTEAFGQPLHLSRFPGGPIDLYMGTPTNRPSAISINPAYLDELRSMPLLRDQGDGMRSFMGVMLAIVAAAYPIVLIDEPEAFLHPPQARLLGRMIASESRETQVVIATHSTDLLFGLLSGGVEHLTVVRVTRTGSVNPVSILPPDQIRQLWSDPLLASSNLLDGLFHSGVVLCEGDTDARYYSSVLEDEHGDASHELFLTHCGGKARMPMVVRALRALEVPVVAVTDLDLLRERERVKGLVEALGETWGAFEHDWTIIDAAVTSMSAAPAIDEVRQAIARAIDDASAKGPRLSRAASEQIRAATRVDDGWGLLKRGGIGALPQGDPSAAMESLDRGLRGIGLVVVPVGEVERWHREIPRKSSAWLDEVLSRRLYAAPGPHREFVRRVAGWFATRA